MAGPSSYTTATDGPVCSHTLTPAKIEHLNQLKAENPIKKEKKWTEQELEMLQIIMKEKNWIQLCKHYIPRKTTAACKLKYYNPRKPKVKKPPKIKEPKLKQPKLKHPRKTRASKSKKINPKKLEMKKAVELGWTFVSENRFSKTLECNECKQENIAFAEKPRKNMLYLCPKCKNEQEICCICKKKKIIPLLTLLPFTHLLTPVPALNVLKNKKWLKK